MDISSIKCRSIRNASLHRITSRRQQTLSDKLNSSDSKTQQEHQIIFERKTPFIATQNTAATAIGKKLTQQEKLLLDKLNSEDGYTQIRDMIILNDKTSFNANVIPKLDVKSLSAVPSTNKNVMDFGSGQYFNYTNSAGKSIAIFANPNGALTRPVSETIVSGREYDKDTERYMHFWNHLASGHAFFLSPNNPNLPALGYSNDNIRSYLDDAGIAQGFFSVKVGTANADFFYSNSEHNPIYTKEEYDFRYYTMTSSAFSYNKSVFNNLDPGTEITISGEKYTLKDDFTLDIPYGTDIYDIQIPKHTPISKVPSAIDRKV